MYRNPKSILNVLQGQVPARRPVWLMRQAGRYLPEYRQLRAKAENFLNLCLTPDWACEITLQPIRRFDMDAAILFADILLVPHALGQGLAFREGEGPVLDALADDGFLQGLRYDDRKLQPVYETLAKVKAGLPAHTTLIGFCGAPWTVACYMIEGRGKTGFKRALAWQSEHPEKMQSLVDCLIDASEQYLGKQIEAGAEVIQIFDSWAGLLQGADFQRWVIAPTIELVKRIKHKYPHVPIIGFPREAGEGYISYIQQTGVDAMSIDQDLDLDFAKQLQGNKVLQGNLSPDLLIAGGEAMKAQLTKIMQTFGPRHIMNLGHGVVPQTPPEHVGAFVDFVHAMPVTE